MYASLTVNSKVRSLRITYTDRLLDIIARGLVTSFAAILFYSPSLMLPLVSLMSMLASLMSLVSLIPRLVVLACVEPESVLSASFRSAASVASAVTRPSSSGGCGGESGDGDGGDGDCGGIGISPARGVFRALELIVYPLVRICDPQDAQIVYMCAETKLAYEGQ